MSSNRTYRSDRPDGRFVSTSALAYHLAKTLKPKLAFDPAMSADAFTAWQSNLRNKLQELMCFTESPETATPKRIDSHHRDGYRVEKWETYPEAGSVVPILILIPDGVSQQSPAPAVLCFPGSTSTKEFLADEPERTAGQKRKFPEHNKMAKWFVDEGMVAVAVDNPVCGQTADDPTNNLGGQREATSMDLIFLGRHYVGLSVFQKMHVLDYVRTLDFVDVNRIAVGGHSLGTEPAMVMAVLDEKIAAVVFNDYLGDVRRRQVCTSIPGNADEPRWNSPRWHHIPGMLKWFDFPDLLAAVAPRPLIVTEGGPTADLKKVAQAYELIDAGTNFVYHYYPKYAAAEDRNDGQTIPEGLTSNEYLAYANVDAPNHYFKEYLAAPWLKDVFAS